MAHSVHLSEDTYLKAKALALSRGFGSVDDFVADFVNQEELDRPEDSDAMFTPEVMAAIAEGVADAKAGRLSSVAEVRSHFAQKSREWRERHDR